MRIGEAPLDESFSGTARALFGRSMWRSNVVHRLLAWMLLVGLAGTLAASLWEARLAAETEDRELQDDLANLGRIVAPALGKSLWAFDRHDADLLLHALVESSHISQVHLEVSGQPTKQLGVETVSPYVLHQEVPIAYVEDGTRHELGRLRLTKDLHGDRARRLKRLMEGLLVRSLVVLFAALGSVALYHVLVTRRVMLLADRMHLTTAADLKRAAAAPPPPMPELHDELDELAVSIAALERTGGAALREIDERHSLVRSLMDNLPTLVWMKDPNGVYLAVNPRYCEFHGRKESGVVGRTDYDLFEREQADLFLASDRATMESTDQHLYQIWMLGADGTRSLFEIVKCAVRAKDGRMVGVLGIARDITQQQADQQELERLNADLEERVRRRTADLRDAKDAAEAANRAKSAFLANMSHEIRTPLNAILGMARFIRRDGLVPSQEQRMDKLEYASQHLLGIIDAVLELSKIEAGKFILEETEVSIDDLMRTVADIVHGNAQAKNLQLVVQTSQLPQPLLGDATRLKQALLNYVSNAVKFTDRGSITLAVSCVEEDPVSALIRWEVRDTGIGVAPEVLTKLFAAFEQADNSTTRKYGGTGLGLAITKNFARLMGGDAGASSTVGEGSCFWFTARLKKGFATTVTDPHSQASTVEKTLIRLHAGKRVLLAEDEPINREISQAMLEDLGLVVDCAENGLQALEMARNQDYAAIVMDMQMPEMDGLEATRRIRELERHRTTPILAMTANAFEEDRQRCKAAGMVDFITKPVAPNTLHESLATWLT